MKLPPVYTETYHFTIELMRRTAHLPKAYRPTLGRRMEEAAMDMTILLRQSLLTPSQRDYAGILSRVDTLKVCLQLAHELEILSPHQSMALSSSLEKIGKMLGGLQKHQKTT